MTPFELALLFAAALGATVIAVLATAEDHQELPPPVKTLDLTGRRK